MLTPKVRFPAIKKDYPRGQFQINFLNTLNLVFLNKGLTFAVNYKNSFIDITMSSHRMSKFNSKFHFDNSESFSDHKMIFFDSEKLNQIPHKSRRD